MILTLVPVDFAAACGFVAMWHRHLAPHRECHEPAVTS